MHIELALCRIDLVPPKRLKCWRQHVKYAHGYYRFTRTNSLLFGWKNDRDDFLASFKEEFGAYSSMKFPKLQSPMHIPHFVRLFGSILNWKAMDYESVHKIAKNEGRHWNHQQSLEIRLMDQVVFIFLLFFLVFLGYSTENSSKTWLQTIIRGVLSASSTNNW